MKLKDTFVTQEIEGTQFLVAVGETSFTGIVKSNKTAAFIVNGLKEKTTKEQIVDAMCQKYDAPRERIETDVENVLNKLRGIGALDE